MEQEYPDIFLDQLNLQICAKVLQFVILQFYVIMMLDTEIGADNNIQSLKYNKAPKGLDNRLNFLSTFKKTCFHSNYYQGYHLRFLVFGYLILQNFSGVPWSFFLYLLEYFLNQLCIDSKMRKSPILGNNRYTKLFISPFFPKTLFSVVKRSY